MKQHIVGVDSIIRKQLADTPQPLVDLILRMTAREPGARVQSAADAASELTALAAEVVPGKMPQKASIAKACLPLLALGLPCILVGSWFLLSSLAAENLCVLTAPLPKGQKAVVQRWLVQIEKDLGREAVAQQLADMGVDKEEEIDKLISVAHAITGDRCDLSSMGKFCDRFGDLSAGLTAAQAKPLIAAVRRLDQRFGEAPNWSFDFHWKLAQSLRESGLRQESLDVMAMSAAANGGRVVDSSLAEFLALLQQLKGQEQVAFYEHDFSRSKEIQRLKSYLSTVGSGESFPYTDSRAIDWILTLTPAEQSKVIYELCCCIAEVQSGSRNNTPAQFSLLQAYANRVRVHTARLDMCVQFIKALELYQAAKFLPALQGFKGILRLDMQMQRLRYPIASYMLPCALHVEPPAARLSELTDLLNRVQADFPESDLVGSIRKAIDGERAKQAAPRPTS